MYSKLARYCIVILIAISPWFVASSTALAQTNVIEPLAVGNKWTYRDSTIFFGNVSTDTSIREIIGETTVTFQNQTYNVYILTTGDGSSNEFVRNESDGLWWLGAYNSSDTLVARYQLIKYPTGVGDKWTIPLYSDENEITIAGFFDFELRAVNQPYATPAGLFFCNVYRLNYLTGPVDYYFAPNVGLVGLRTDVGGIIQKSVLLSTNLVTVASDRQPERAIVYSLSQNYPNPFNPSTQITFALPSAQKVTLKVFELTGKEVATLLQNAHKPAGVHQLTFDAATLASGVYFYQLRAGEFTETKKMLLTR